MNHCLRAISQSTVRHTTISLSGTFIVISLTIDCIRKCCVAVSSGRVLVVVGSWANILQLLSIADRSFGRNCTALRCTGLALARHNIAQVGRGRLQLSVHPPTPPHSHSCRIPPSPGAADSENHIRLLKPSMNVCVFCCFTHPHAECPPYTCCAATSQQCQKNAHSCYGYGACDLHLCLSGM